MAREGGLLDRLEGRAPRLHRLLTSHRSPFPLLRDLLGVALVLAVMVGALWGLTGQGLGDAPVVVVESGSMMHCANGIGLYHGNQCQPKRYGRLGTIDPGDLIFVRATPAEAGARDMILTFGQDAGGRYGLPGDVIIYRPNGEPFTPIIHRAMFWMEVHGDGTASIPELGIERVRDPDARDLQIDAAKWRIQGNCKIVTHGLGPADSGWITKGDNNPCFDQAGDRAPQKPVQPEWLLGKARGEVPWIGLLKLKASHLFGGGTDHYGNAPSDVRTMLWVSVVVFVAAPFTIEFVVRRVRASRQAAGEEDGPDARAAQPGGGDPVPGDTAQAPSDGRRDGSGRDDGRHDDGRRDDSGRDDGRR